MSLSATTSYSFRTAQRIVAGPHTFEAIDEQLKEIGMFRHALIITQPSMVRSGVIDTLVKRLRHGGISCQVTTDIKPEPTINNLEEVHHSLTDDFDLYIGIGGGSVLDATKVLSALRTNSCAISEMLGTNLVQKPGVPMVLIPTTSGTGSEVTPNAIVTLPQEELKVGIVSKYMLPQLAVLDPALTISLPPAITAATGMDAFTHSIESYISNKANPISDMFALESIRLISRSILTAYQQGDNLAAREDMLIGSMLGGMALSAAGTAAVHALAYPLGGSFHIPHGVANSMLLPHVMEFQMDAITGRLEAVAQAMGLTHEGGTFSGAEKVVTQIKEWTKLLDIPQNLREYGVEPGDIGRLAISASKVTRLLTNNPKPVSVEDMEGIYRRLLENPTELS
jgi:alcohol dehydrogenase